MRLSFSYHIYFSSISFSPGTNNHAGNVKFRLMVNGPNKLRYLAASKSDKPRVASDVVKLWRELDPPGRFLARRDTSRKGPGSVKVWWRVSESSALVPACLSCDRSYSILDQGVALTYHFFLLLGDS
jgi:hypothetical protein